MIIDFFASILVPSESRRRIANSRVKTTLSLYSEIPFTGSSPDWGKDSSLYSRDSTLVETAYQVFSVLI